MTPLRKRFGNVLFWLINDDKNILGGMIMYYENFKNCEDFVNSFDGLSKDDKQRYIEESLLFEEFIMDCRLKILIWMHLFMIPTGSWFA